MPDTKYEIEYVVNSTRAVAGLGKADAGIRSLDATVTRSYANLAKYQALLNSLGASFTTLGQKAVTTEKAVAGVGRGNANLTAMTKRVAELEAAIAKLSATSSSATPVVAGVGQGGPPGGGGGRGPQGPINRPAGIGAFGVAVGGAAIAGMRKVVSVAGDAVAEKIEFQGSTAEKAAQFRRGLKGVSVLKGKIAPDADDMKEDLAFMKETLLPPEMSGPFRAEFGGAIEASTTPARPGEAPNVDPKMVPALEREAARFTARYGLDPKTGGRMAGLMGVMQKVPSVEAGIGTMAKAMEVLNVKGVGEVKDIAPQLLSLTAGMLDPSEGGGGRFKDLPEMAARMAVSTINEAGDSHRAKTRIIQSDKLLRRFSGEETGAFLRKAGITQSDDYETAINKIAPHIEGPGGYKKLFDSGFHNDTEIRAVIAEAKQNARAKEFLNDPKMDRAYTEAIARNREYRYTDEGRAQAAEIGDFSAEIEVGMAGDKLRTAKTNARARMKGSGTFKAGIGQSILDATSSFWAGGAASGEDMRVEAEAFRDLEERGQRHKVDVSAMAPNASYRAHHQLPLDTDQSRGEFNRASEAVEGAERLHRKLQEAADAARDLGRGADPAPPGDGGAGVNPMRR